MPEKNIFHSTRAHLFSNSSASSLFAGHAGTASTLNHDSIILTADVVLSVFLLKMEAALS